MKCLDCVHRERAKAVVVSLSIEKEKEKRSVVAQVVVSEMYHQRRAQGRRGKRREILKLEHHVHPLFTLYSFTYFLLLTWKYCRILSPQLLVRRPSARKIMIATVVDTFSREEMSRIILKFETSDRISRLLRFTSPEVLVSSTSDNAFTNSNHPSPVLSSVIPHEAD